MNQPILQTPKESYYTHTRLDMISMLDAIPETVLEVGCGTGNTLRYLKKQGTRETFGIELDSTMAEVAMRQVDHVAVGDIEAMEWPFAGKLFDCIILGDVLEHLRDPWSVLRTLSESLISGGQIVASLPNVGSTAFPFRFFLEADGPIPKRVFSTARICDFLLEKLLSS